MNLILKDESLEEAISSNVHNISELQTGLANSDQNTLTLRQDFNILNNNLFNLQENMSICISEQQNHSNRLDSLDGENGSISSIETRLDSLDGDETTSLRNQVSALSGSLEDLSASLSSISTEISKIKAKMNSIHGEGTI